MPVIRTCKICGRKNRIPVARLADAGRCGTCKAVLPPLDEPLDVDPQLFNEMLQKVHVPVLVDFWAAWCGPCRMSAPEVVRTAADMSGRAIILKVDTERYPGLAAQFKISGIPHFIIFSSGRPVIRQAGLMNHEQLESLLKSAPVAAAS
jgi:thioredoxin 2